MQEQVFRLRTKMMLERGSGGDEVVLIDGHTGSMCACNASAAAMLMLLECGASESALAVELTRRFAISANRADEDARHFLQSLSAMGTIEIIDSNELSSKRLSGDTDLQPA